MGAKVSDDGEGSFVIGSATRTFIGACFTGLVLSLFALPTTAQRLSDDDVRKLMIQESISSYHGSCPCPYNFAANGSQCGRRSAYSRPGGASPLCYLRIPVKSAGHSD